MNSPEATAKKKKRQPTGYQRSQERCGFIWSSALPTTPGILGVWREHSCPLCHLSQTLSSQVFLWRINSLRWVHPCALGIQHTRQLRYGCADPARQRWCRISHWCRMSACFTAGICSQKAFSKWASRLNWSGTSWNRLRKPIYFSCVSVYRVVEKCLNRI